MEYLKYTIPSSSENQEILIALLSELPFDSFLESTTQLEAFIPEKEWSESIDGKTKKIISTLGLDSDFSKIPYQNWNKTWEESFDPILIPDKCVVRAAFHDSRPEIPYEIVIQPQMAFGTGHHATTFMMMEQMFFLDFKDKKVLDYGSGTGILAILASKLGSNNIDAIDNDPLSFENMAENFSINQIENVVSHLGKLDKLSNNQYDIILANINRNVLLAGSSALFNQLNPEGIILISGILPKDRVLVSDTFIKDGFHLNQVYEKEDWICIKFHKTK